jgi:hypothetical protein
VQYRRRIVDGPKRDWSNDEQAAKFLCVSAVRFRQLVDAGWIKIERRMANHRQYHWTSLVVANMRMAQGEIPPEPERRKSGKNRQNQRNSGENGQQD